MKDFRESEPAQHVKTEDGFTLRIHEGALGSYRWGITGGDRPEFGQPTKSFTAALGEGLLELKKKVEELRN